jgi:type IV secretory pathway VirB10-like protein
MAKKNFDTFLQTVKPASKVSPEEIEAMAREVHAPKNEQPVKVAAQPAAAPPPKPVVESEPRSAQEQGRRGRKPKPREAERLIRVSVDLPESVFITLGARCVREKTDKMAYVRALVERDLAEV